ncbi:hypothetical protein TSUD_360620 [Trifolium subterraneum]|uniref:Uncharacterized protein n=1 Tax=Trifolium subterraneum TaxID=3900 RepID=A0A2Z6NJM3_TRISU|nr:hypothetical protein TSUD_360620 [Trifolium subterraneum]
MRSCVMGVDGGSRRDRNSGGEDGVRGSGNNGWDRGGGGLDGDGISDIRCRGRESGVVIEIDSQFVYIDEFNWFKWRQSDIVIFLDKSKTVKVRWCGVLRGYDIISGGGGSSCGRYGRRGGGGKYGWDRGSGRCDGGGVGDNCCRGGESGVVIEIDSQFV